MAQHGVDLALTGHDHSYQRWVPLDGAGNPHPAGITQFIAGGGGHGIQQFIKSDDRMAKGFDTNGSFGALRLELNSQGAVYQLINVQGVVMDSGATSMQWQRAGHDGSIGAGRERHCHRRSQR